MAGQPCETSVAQQEDNGFWPLHMLRERAATVAAFVVVVVSCVVLVVREDKNRERFYFLVYPAAQLILNLVFNEPVRSLCLVAEEIQHKETRYEGNWKHVFNSFFAFGYSRSYVLLVTVCFTSILIGYYEPFPGAGNAILAVLNVSLIRQFFLETSKKNERENENVARGLAWAYYFGYLKLVLPYLEHKIAESKEFRLKITSTKLFILLPKTCYTYDDITDTDFRVKWAGYLPTYKIIRSGIKARSYRHLVHRIEMPRPDGMIDEYHFVLEYATPLMTLYDMSVEADSPLSRQERDHQVHRLFFSADIEDITRWREDMNFMFSWQKQYRFCHENIQFISLSQRVMFFLLYGDQM